MTHRQGCLWFRSWLRCLGWVLASCLPAAAQVIARSSLADLPEAPGIGVGQAAGVPQSAVAGGSIAGVVVDLRGDPIVEARAALVEEGQPERHVSSNAAGEFRFPELGAGKYRVTVSAAGFESYVSPEITLLAGEQHSLPRVVLQLAAENVSVQVTATLEEIAQAQVHLEEKQRVLGVFPNFYTSYIWQAAPLNRRQKFDLAAHSIFDPVIFAATGAAAGIEHARNTFPAYGGGPGGYAQRYAADYADEVSARMFSSAIFPSLFHQDPRYFYKGSGRKKSRVLYAVTRSLVTRGDNGLRQPNYSRILGAFVSGTLSNAYHLGNDRGVGLTFRNSSIALGGNAGDNLLREFLFKRFTPNVPDYADGKK